MTTRPPTRTHTHTASTRPSSPRTRARRRRLFVCLLTAALVGAGLVTVMAATAGQAVAAQQRWLINMTGRGYGHGVGMSQWGAQGLAQHGRDYKAILRHYYRGISFGSTGDRTVRVLLTAGQSPVKITSAGAYTVTVGSTTQTVAANVVTSITRSGSTYSASAGGATWTSGSPIEVRPGGSLLRLVNRNLNGWSTTADATYRGSLTVVSHASLGLCTVNTVALESYLRGVVPREMPSSWHQEALRAQAVAARTFAIKRLGSSGPFDLYCDTRSQVYGGAGGEVASTTSAVTATRGVIATYGGTPIEAFYFSTSGGRTENCENVFWATLPYLKSVDDPYDSASPYHTWPDNPLQWSSGTVKSKLGAGSTPSGGLQALYVVSRGASPRVRRALAISSSGATALSGATLRARLGLRDTWFSVRSMSMIPGEGARLAKGARIEVRGRTYPALAASAVLKLYYYRGGRWRSVKVPADRIRRATRTVTAGGRSYKLSYSTYSYRIRPGVTTTYRFGTGSYRSPKTKVTIGGATPSPTPTVTPTGSPTPAPSPTPSDSPEPSASPSAIPSATPSGQDAVRGQALATRVARRGTTVTLRYRLLGTAGDRGHAVIKIRRADGRAVKTLVLKDRPVGTALDATFRCWLTRGRYRYYVYGLTADGVWQTARPSSKPLIVR